MQNADGWVQVGLAVVSIGLSLWLIRRERHTRGLSDAILSNRPLVTAQSSFPLEVRLRDVPVHHPSLLVWRLVNTGAQPIQVSDYEENIALTIAGATIVSADVA